ncbi:MAG: hypothetical protein HOD97_05015 [Candidatus Marinimicrobia bacterium]|jgi:hypothetical protein|nr:hypothetical protein [Candidatus Neomarinimicrobiota bacterium]MBT3617438.1 hypothetical protein [Candidatus Neomarinimicrobiota bacterium]MBT3829378.1 hypothetical protein [Candidatus Neomarinimicrobiota bacterium]MBT3997661.1 hypothetical protein [Candidatus Neomarinimicrobiota bacterium]MBT4280959.1 hypothetical protein [Candidatus Neomarinimicrobiota bacterium]
MKNATLIFLALILSHEYSFSQEIQWKNAPKRTAISIGCDSPNVPIYLDDHFIGKSPLENPINVTPGWHRVSIFPNMKNESIRTISKSRRIRDIVKMGFQDIYVEEGKIENVALTYNRIEAEVDVYDKKMKSAKTIGFSVMLLFVSLVGWALS